MAFTGGKSVNGVFQQIINQIPPHDVYIEPFLGDGAILRRKRPANRTIAIDSDPKVLERWAGDEVPNLELYHCDGIEWLRYAFGLHRINAPRASIGSRLASFNPAAGTVFVYADPPYPRSTRASRRRLYRHEMSDAHHIDFLKTMTTLPCHVMVSSYWSEMYADWLADWRLHKYPFSTRSNRRVVECLWMNFEVPSELHEYTHVGDNKRDRERIRRKVGNWRAGLARLPALERNALLQAILDRTYFEHEAKDREGGGNAQCSSS